MPYSVTFADYTPAARGANDGPWTGVRIEQAGEHRNGPWTVIGSSALSPVDADPTQPASRTLTTDLATIYPGWFRVVWVDDASGEQPSDPEFAGSATRATVQEVANLMPDRTTVDGGDEARTFNDQTSPTGTEVDALIDMVLDSVDPRVPADAAPEVTRAARHVVTLQTAILVEAGNWGDQLETNEARVELWERLLARHEATLDAAANDNTAGNVRFGSLTVLSPTLSAQGYGWSTTELIP